MVLIALALYMELTQEGLIDMTNQALLIQIKIVGSIMVTIPMALHLQSGGIG